MKKTKQSKEAAGRMVQNHDILLFGSAIKDTWKRKAIEKPNEAKYFKSVHSQCFPWVLPPHMKQEKIRAKFSRSRTKQSCYS